MGVLDGEEKLKKFKKMCDYLVGGNSNIFYFHPETWGR